MLNRPQSTWLSESQGEECVATRGIDASPRLRIGLLSALLVVPLIGIGFRLAHVQLTLGDEYAREFERTTERIESIPSRDGRILASDGQVLAEDLEIFRLKVHYRWIEEPADPGWLRGQALRRLDRPARRDPERVAEGQRQVLRDREELWSLIVKQTGVDEELLAKKRRSVQRRVEQIHARVLKERERRAKEAHASTQSLFLTDGESSGTWSDYWNRVVAALTTPPRREETEPLVIQEQLDYHLLVDNLTLESAVEIEAGRERFPGTRIEVAARRTYPQGTVAAHVLGYRLPVSDELLAERRARFPDGDPLDYRLGDRMGITGIERHYERRLRGLRGERVLVLNRRGEVIEERVAREPRYGQDLVLGLSMNLQQSAEELLDATLNGPQIDETNGKSLPTPTGGAIVAIDIRTGSILAAASAPRFDPRVLVEHDQAGWSAIQADARQPLFHRATEMTLPPGSVFKVVSAVGFLESGRLDPERAHTCLGYLDSPERYRCYTFKHYGVGHGDVNLTAALARSCNVYFFDAARRIGSAPLIQWADRFGLGRATGVDLPGERVGSLPALETAVSSKRARGTSGEALQLAIGQGKLTATPLQIARMMAAIANGGRLVTPHFAQSTGTVRTETDPADASLPSMARSGEPIPDLSNNTLAWVRQGLTEVVAHPKGTGYKTVRLPTVQIAGKTGTAEPGGGRPDHAWFAGYVPAGSPRVAFVVVLEHAGPGGHAAGPVARKLVQAMQVERLLGGVELPSAN